MAAKDRTMVVLTSKNLETMITEGGCAYWRARKESILKCQYLLATRNRHSTWVQGSEKHGSAFLLGEINGVEEVESGRYVVKLSRFTTIDVPNVWPGVGANPVRYISLSDIPAIDLAKVEWQAWPNTSPVAPSPTVTAPPPGMTIERAKAELATTFGVRPEQIEITIKG